MGETEMMDKRLMYRYMFLSFYWDNTAVVMIPK